MDAFGRSYRRVITQRNNTISSIEIMANLFPKSLLRSLQIYDETSCFRISDPKNDLVMKDGKIHFWQSQSENKMNLKLIKGSHAIERVERFKYAIIFNETYFINEELFFLENYADTFGFICVTFQVFGEKEQTLISDYKKPQHESFHEIAVAKDYIKLFCCGHIEYIQHPCHYWSTLFLSYRGYQEKTIWQYCIDNDPQISGIFCSENSDIIESGITVGSRCDGTREFHGKMTSFEIYNKDDYNGLLFPEPMKQLIISQQMVSVDAIKS